MLAIESQYNKSVTIKRLAPGEDSGEAYEEHITNVACHIQPLDESFTEDLTGNFGKDFLLFTAVQDILEGDKVIDGSDVYLIVGLEKYNFLGANRHMEARIRKQNG